MRKLRSTARRGARTVPGVGPAGGGALIARIVVLLLLIAAILVAMLYGTGALDGEPVDPFNLTGFDPPAADPAAASPGRSS